MTLLNTLIASSVVALGALVQTATPVSATGLAPIGSNHAARHSSGHGGMIKRKRSTHKNRKRCIQPPTTIGSGNNNGGSTDNGGSSNNGGSSSGGSSGGSTGGTYTPPANSLACQGGKAGMAWGPSMATNTMPLAITNKMCYYYNWSSWKSGEQLSKSLHFVPMYWGPGHEGDFTDNIINSDTNYGAVLAMNEVNERSQANLDLGGGLYHWNTYVLPLRQKGYRLGSPSVTNDPTTGLPWLTSFRDALDANSKPDFWSIHWYGTNAADFKSYVQSCINQLGKVWITEFACTNFADQGWQCDTAAFANEVVPWLDANDGVEAYFPFAFVNEWTGVNPVNQLWQENGWDWGQYTALGAKYFS